MKNQTIINCVFAVAFVGYVVSQRNPTFGTITCKSWYVVDADGKYRIQAVTSPIDGFAGVIWSDKDGKTRITAETRATGDATVQWRDKDGHSRITAETYADGNAASHWYDTNGNTRISASTFANGDVDVALKGKDGEPSIRGSPNGVMFYDKDGKPRIAALIGSDGTVVLPTRDLSPPKKP